MRESPHQDLDASKVRDAGREEYKGDWLSEVVSETSRGDIIVVRSDVLSLGKEGKVTIKTSFNPNAYFSHKEVPADRLVSGTYSMSDDVAQLVLTIGARQAMCDLSRLPSHISVDWGDEGGPVSFSRP